ncbi:hypothetical protein GCM10025867_50700 (plasmid) [Frondihabitans sucicola]|uniref:Uncharacterized protein n=1 Tax=Frondihabitans sucicola TaxID=1268041 RepID=A0ABM8GWJ0_9MICO|nr:hypothetical protein [Frondihabitans sucicola]BDZ52829.1 hypothetical protein GCM10025867_50700 [Frondihabitans sucicola]
MTQPGTVYDAAFTDGGCDFEVFFVDRPDAGGDFNYVIELADTQEHVAMLPVTSEEPPSAADIIVAAQHALTGARALLQAGDSVRIGDLLATLLAPGNTTSWYVRFADGEEGSYSRSRMVPNAKVDPHA